MLVLFFLFRNTVFFETCIYECYIYIMPTLINSSHAPQLTLKFMSSFSSITPFSFLALTYTDTHNLLSSFAIVYQLVSCNIPVLSLSYCFQLYWHTFKALSHAKVAKLLENNAEMSHLNFAKCLANYLAFKGFILCSLNPLVFSSSCSSLSWIRADPYFCLVEAYLFSSFSNKSFRLLLNDYSFY